MTRLNLCLWSFLSFKFMLPETSTDGLKIYFKNSNFVRQEYLVRLIYSQVWFTVLALPIPPFTSCSVPPTKAITLPSRHLLWPRCLAWLGSSFSLFMCSDFFVPLLMVRILSHFPARLWPAHEFYPEGNDGDIISKIQILLLREKGPLDFCSRALTDWTSVFSEKAV